MKIEKLIVGAIETNCYILEKENCTVIVDPGASARRIIETLGERVPDAILLTHGHYDHTGAVDKLYHKYHLTVYAAKEDEPLLKTDVMPGFDGESSIIDAPVTWLKGNELKIGPFSFKVHYCPGHSAGSVMFETEGVLFSGDTLFAGSVGRTDLYSGSYSQLKQSLQIVYQLPPEMTVLPGHGEETTVGRELLQNPYL